MKTIIKFLSWLKCFLDRGAFTHDLTSQRSKFIENIRSKK